MMGIRMIALDLDGTTLNSRREITVRTQEAFRKASEKGVHIVVSTGRTFTALPQQVRELSYIEYAITSNGAHINLVSTGESIFDSYLSVTAVREAARLYGELDTEIEVFVDGRAYMDQSYYDYIVKYGLSTRSAEYVLWSRTPVNGIEDLLLENENHIENINFCFNDEAAYEAGRRAIESIPDATISSSFRNSLEVGGPETSKKAALIELTGRLGIDRSELMCCGDAPNDIEMISYAGLGVAVGNAWGGTKENADYITGTNDEDGVAQAIEKFVLI